MLRILLILLEGSFFLGCRSADIINCNCPKVSPRLCSPQDGTLLKLNESAQALNAQQVVIFRLTEIANRLIDQTEDLYKLKSYSHGTSSARSRSGALIETLGRSMYFKNAYPNSCSQATADTRATGLYTIKVGAFSSKPFLAYCNEDVDGGGWTVIQRRVSDSIDFDRDWVSYQVGFGNLMESFFIGLNRLSALTGDPQELLIILTDFEGIRQTARYDGFAIGGKHEFYNLKVLGNFTGYIGDSLSFHRGMNFSTKDMNTNTMTDRHCAKEFTGGWWYNNCQESNLNGLHLKKYSDKASQGIVWYSWHGCKYSFKSAEMLIRTRRDQSCSDTPKHPTSCDDLSLHESKIITVRAPTKTSTPFKVYCEEEVHGGGWTVVQRRVDDTVDFYRDWNEYKAGFGDLEGNFYIGNDKLHALSKVEPQELLITLTDFDNVTKYARYDGFAIGDESESYVLKVLGKYSGNAGDSFSYQKGMKFTTIDRKNDFYSINCAKAFKGGWWYNACHNSNLNGLYLKGEYGKELYSQGINWSSWHGYYYSLKIVSMMIRPKDSFR